MIEGSIVALVTPMLADGSIDWNRLDDLVDWHIEAGTSAIGAVGTTGESPTLTVEEHLGVIKAVAKRAAGRVPVVAGTGANSTSEAIEWTQAAEKLGADYTLQVVPYYNKPTQEGLYQHFKAVAEATALPVILYNVPARTITDLLPETLERLANIDNIVGIKDATGDLERGRETLRLFGSEFAVYSGDDPTSTELILSGAVGTISVTANLIPEKMAELCRLALAGERDQALALDASIQPLNQQLSLESNPIPVKWALYRMGKIDQGIRLPLTPLSENLRPGVENILTNMQLTS